MYFFSYLKNPSTLGKEFFVYSFIQEPVPQVPTVCPALPGAVCVPSGDHDSPHPALKAHSPVGGQTDAHTHISLPVLPAPPQVIWEEGAKLILDTSPPAGLRAFGSKAQRNPCTLSHKSLPPRPRVLPLPFPGRPFVPCVGFPAW
ncbi:hypothetical protein mRhiFer1_009147 [Rhinolophus ferrumequinum]|uniref:Uncharacterized protein n=1 Tax=Rhinolophus ferrumequinum TaxID=59479 RepID=A0A7J7SJD7_RHIFE|nr:hypothetical protein mRhiFer1_009147 [Rhinolophus ferrumequinum]